MTQGLLGGIRSKSKASKCLTAYTAKVKIINNVGGSTVQNWNIDKMYISVDDLKRDQPAQT